MRCPKCGSLDTQVKDSRPTEDSAAIRRRRVCLSCNFRFTTFERVQLRELTVIKRNGRRLPFDRDKLARSVEIALRKRNVEPERIEQTVSKIVQELESLGESEVSSETIGMSGKAAVSIATMTRSDARSASVTGVLSSLWVTSNGSAYTRMAASPPASAARRAISSNGSFAILCA